MRFGFIETFLKLTDDKNVQRYLAVIEAPKVLTTTMSKDAVAKLNHMIPISSKSTTYDICDIIGIKGVCCYVQSGNGLEFIIEFPNRIEKD